MTLRDLHKITKSITKSWIRIKRTIDHIGVLQTANEGTRTIAFKEEQTKTSLDINNSDSEVGLHPQSQWIASPWSVNGATQANLKPIYWQLLLPQISDTQIPKIRKVFVWLLYFHF